jgi:hypothetical protein
MKAHNPKIKLSTVIALLFGIFIFCVMGLFALGNYIDAFRFTLINIGEAGESQTKEEAIHRNTFVCDIKLLTQPYKVSNTHVLYFKTGWIEQSWRGGFWYWTTHKDTDNFYYNIVLQCSKAKWDTVDWRIINKETSPHSGYMVLQDNMSNLGTITGLLNSLPVNDTLRYTVLKRDTIDFHPSNIDGTLVLILQNYATYKAD